jgi:hypothetical protein
MRAVGFPTMPTARILLQYLGDVKLYGQRRKRGNQPLSDIGTPPRFVIRRRFIRAMFDTATGGYARWYVVAHSLGSVVALNGLVEPAHSLPNYLDERRWETWKSTRPQRERRLPDDAKVTDVNDMWPARPAWLDDRDAIDRQALFENFRGLLTYGSPLDKFAVLFPATVPLNRDMHVFPKSSEWINVHDPTDLVAGSLDFFGPFRDSEPVVSQHRALAPSNFAILGWPVALWSHITYFTNFASTSRERITPLADTVQRWIIRDKRFKRALRDAECRPCSPLAAYLWRKFQQAQTLAFFFATLFLLALAIPAAQRATTALWGGVVAAASVMFIEPWGWVSVASVYLGKFGSAALAPVACAWKQLDNSLPTGTLGNAAEILLVAIGVVAFLGILGWLLGTDTQRPERDKR